MHFIEGEESRPLLCISLLALLLLPLSLSCDVKSPPQDVRNDYPFVRPHLDKTAGSIATSLQNSSCPELRHKLRGCKSENANLVNTLHILSCKMEKLQLSHTRKLVTSVLISIRCPCPERPTNEPIMKMKKRSTATRRRRNELRKSSRETTKLCKAKAILSTMTECYEMLNTLFKDT